MLDADEIQDLFSFPRSPLNPEGFVGRQIAPMPTHGLSAVCGIVDIELSWEAFKMPDCPRHLLPSAHKGCKNWEVSQWNGCQIFRATVMGGLGGRSRFLFFVPDEFPIVFASIEDQCDRWSSEA